LDLSMDELSTTRSAAVISRSIWLTIRRRAKRSPGRQRPTGGMYTICSLFAICSWRGGGWCP